MAVNDKISTKPVSPSWKDAGFSSTLQRNAPGVVQGQYIQGAQFNTTLQELLFNRMIKLKNLPASQIPQGPDPGKIYWDKDNQKYKIWVNEIAGWCDIPYTSTSTSTTSSSTSSSTSSTSTSSSTSSTSSSSSSSSSTSSTSSSSSSSTSTTHT